MRVDIIQGIMKRFLKGLAAGRSFALITVALSLALCGFLVIGRAGTACAQQRGLNAETSEKVDAILLLDTSGSMLLNDPQRLRDEGARLFIQFLKPGDSLAIVDFSETASVVRPLTPYEPSQAESVGTLISGLKTEGQYTDLLVAIEKAREVIETQGRADAKPVIVLLSDGKMDPNPTLGSVAQRTQTLLEQVLPDLRTRSRRVYTLAFSPDADKELLQQIAASTDAIQWFSPSVNDVHQSFAELFLAVKRPQVIPLGAKGFTVDENVSEATFYINRATEREVQIQNPRGQIFTAKNYPSNVKWFNSQRFEVITIEKPEIGAWQVSGVTKEEGFATILTNLRLITDWGAAIEAGREVVLQARLYESEKPVSLPEMTGLIRYAYQITPTDRVAEPIVRDILGDEGTSGDSIANDGIFAHAIQIDEPGEYELRIIAKAPTFERQLQIPFRVRPPFVVLSAHAGTATSPSESAGHAVDSHGKADHGDSSHGDPAPASHGTHGDSHGDAHGATDGHAESASEPGAALPEEGGLVSGDPTTTFLIQLNDEAKRLKNVEVQLSATDDQRRLIKIPIEPVGVKVGEYQASAALLPADGRYELKATVSGEGKGRAAVREASRPLMFKRVTVGGQAHTVVVVSEDAPKPEEEEGFPVLGLVLLIVILTASGVAALVMAKRGQGETKVEAKTTPVSEELLARIKELEERKDLTEVDVNAPEFEETSQPAA